jgi:hypothetical protein
MMPESPFSRRLCIAGLCLALAACTAQPVDRTTTDNTVPDQSMATPPAAPAVTAVPEPTEPMPQDRPITPDSLIGQTAAQITTLFGTPVFVRRDPPGEFWRYRGKSCVMEMFFYRRAGAVSLNHVETRGNGAASKEKLACIAALRKRGS